MELPDPFVMLELVIRELDPRTTASENPCCVERRRRVDSGLDILGGTAD